jgi:membrane-anchored protein YejM (alkaline phosphatase superfamily)
VIVDGYVRKRPRAAHRGRYSYSSSCASGTGTSPRALARATLVARRYEHELRYLDQQLGRLLRALAARQRPNAVVSADHGEEFIAGGRHHG